MKQPTTYDGFVQMVESAVAAKPGLNDKTDTPWPQMAREMVAEMKLIQGSRSEKICVEALMSIWNRFIHPNRAALMAALPEAWSGAKRKAEFKQKGQRSIFDIE